MFSLVAAYSDSDNSGEEEEAVCRLVEQDKNLIHEKKLIENRGDNKGLPGGEDDNKGDKDEGYFNLNPARSKPFVPFFGDEVDEEEDEEEEEEEEKPPTQYTKPLSNPFRQNGSQTLVKGDAVFEIPFLDQEIKKAAALERHVKMTQAAGTQEMINGKKICWNYRKGKCRFGHNCIFAHDSDIQQVEAKKKVETKTQTFVNIPEKPESHNSSSNVAGYDEDAVVISSPHLGAGPHPVSGSSVQKSSELPLEKLSEGIGKKGKRRPGLAQTLHPGKKVMKAYHQNSQPF